MFRPISGHPKVHNWSLKHIEEDIHFMYVHKTQLKLLKLIKVISRNNISR